MKITFIAKEIKEVKTKISKKQTLESQVERFRVDMLAKHDLCFKKIPHLIQITH